jgi:hypothetical protein
MEYFVVNIDKTVTGPLSQADAWKQWETIPGHEADALVVRAASPNSALHKVAPLFGW